MEKVDVDKTKALKECIICHYHYFLDKGFQFQPDFCNECHDALMMSVNFDENGADYQCIINRISKKEAIIRVKKMKCHKFFYHHI